MKRKLMVLLFSLVLLTGCMELPEEETTFLYIPPTEAEEEVFYTTESTTEIQLPEQAEYSGKRFFFLESYAGDRDSFGKFYYFGRFDNKVIEMDIRPRVCKEGVDQAGVLLFVDGYPQPYSTKSNDNITYLHPLTISSLIDGEKESAIFTPVRGQNADLLELTWFTITEPNSFLHNGNEPEYQHTAETEGSTTRILLCADPEPPELLPSGHSLSYVTTWEPMENNGDVNWTFTVNGQEGGYLEDITPETPLQIRAECWGMEGAKFTIVVFVDHKPVDDIWTVTLLQNQKTCIEGTLYLSDFDEHAIVYAMLVPRNTTDPAFDYITFQPLASQTFYLTD